MARLNDGRRSSRPENFVNNVSSVFPWDPTKTLLCKILHSDMSKRSVLTLFVCAFFIVGLPAWGQTDVNDVHIVPREIEKP